MYQTLEQPINEENDEEGKLLKAIQEARTRNTKLIKVDPMRTVLMGARKVPLHFDIDGVHQKSMLHESIINTKEEMIYPCSLQYTITNHRPLLGAFEQLLQQSEHVVVERTLWVTATHSRMIARFWLDGNTEAEVKEGDILRFGYQVMNSYDGSYSVSVQLVALRLICKNGMMRRSSIGEKFFLKHTQEFDAGRLRSWFADASNLFGKWTTDLQTARETYIDPPIFDSLFTIIGENEKDVATLDLTDRKEIQHFRNLPKGTRKAIRDRFNDHEEPTAWGGYNAITYVGTHKTKSMVTQMGLEQSAERFLELICP